MAAVFSHWHEKVAVHFGKRLCRKLNIGRMLLPRLHSYTKNRLLPWCICKIVLQTVAVLRVSSGRRTKTNSDENFSLITGSLPPRRSSCILAEVNQLFVISHVVVYAVFVCITSTKEVMFSSSALVCLFVSRITQKLLDRFSQDSVHRKVVPGQGNSD